VSVAVVTGHALGGGFELALAPDVRVWHEGATAAFLQTKLGVVTGWGGTARLLERVPRNLAIRLLVGGERVSLEAALRHGLADARVDGDAASPAWRDALLALPPPRSDGSPVDADAHFVAALPPALRAARDGFVLGLAGAPASADVLRAAKALVQRHGAPDEEAAAFRQLWFAPTHEAAVRERFLSQR
jgi:enoyl-CoA hydratase/carnithine racemase